MEWVVEPGDFSIMIGASSEDIRLSGKLTVEDPNAPMQAQAKTDAPVTASTNPESAMNVLDKKMNTVWEGNKGDYITFALENGSKVDGVSIAFSRGNGLPAEFEISFPYSLTVPE